MHHHCIYRDSPQIILIPRPLPMSTVYSIHLQRKTFSGSSVDRSLAGTSSTGSSD
jgi:hypothetical protein